MAGKRRSTIMLKMEECELEEIITTIYVFSAPKLIFSVQPFSYKLKGSVLY